MTAMNHITTPDGYERCTGISDEEIEQMAREAFAKLPTNLKAIDNKFIAWLAPFRKDGVIEIPWDFQDNSCEAVMVSDGTGYDVPSGTRIMVHPHEGFEHHVNGVKLGFFPASALIFVVEE